MTTERRQYLERRKRHYHKKVKRYIYLLKIFNTLSFIIYLGVILVFVLYKDTFVALSIVLTILFSLKVCNTFLKRTKRSSREKIRRINDEIWLDSQSNFVI